jgi:hypothetical protein
LRAALAAAGEKACQRHPVPRSAIRDQARQLSQRNGRNLTLDLPGAARFHLGGSVPYGEIQNRHPCRRVPQRIHFEQRPGERNGVRFHAWVCQNQGQATAGSASFVPSSAGAATGRARSSRIIGEGAVTASLIFTVR